MVNPPKLIHWFYVTCDMNVFYPGHIISRLWDVNWRWNQHLYVSHCNILISILEADSNIKIRREHYQMQINFNLMQISRKAGTAGDKRILLIFLVKTQVLRLLSILILKVSIFTIQWIPAHPSRKSTRSPRQTVGVFLARTLQSRLVCRLSFFCLFFVPVLYRKTYFPFYDHLMAGDCTSRLNLGCSRFLCQTFYRSSESFDVKVPITLSILGYLTFGADSIVILF